MRPTPHPDYDVLVVLSYYAPYVSGVTEAARVTAEGLLERGWRVAVVCGHHDPSTPRREVINGVDVYRTRVALRIGKGIVSPGFVPTVARLARRSRLVHLHAPLLEAGAIAAAVRSTPLVLTYHCDVTLSESSLDRVQVQALDRSHRAAIRRAAAVLVTSEDYAQASRLRDALRGRTSEVPVPCIMRPPGSPAYRDGNGLHVGFLGRIVEEKGLEYLVAGFRALGPEARLVIGGDFAKVAGGSVVEKVQRAIGDDSRIRMLGFVPDDALADFYASVDVFALPSINALEAFGIVQVEAMMQGIPSVASDLPGVRVPVLATGFGEIVPPRNAAAITEALKRLAQDPPDSRAGAMAARDLYLADNVIDRHASLFASLTTTTVSDTAIEQGVDVSLDDVAKHWSELGESDPLWAVLTDGDKKGNRWDPEEFLASGEAEIKDLVTVLESNGIEVTRGTAVDFGCGAGRLTQGLAAAGFARAIGVDVSEPMILKARELNKQGDRCSFVVNATADLSQLESSSVDLVYTCRVLQHMPPTLAHGYIREFFRLARPGAPVVFQIPNHPTNSLVGRTMRLVPAPVLNRIRKGMEMHGTPDDVVRELVAAAGGELVKAVPSTAAGHRWESHLYLCRKVTRPE